MPATSANPVILPVTVGVVNGGANQRTYNFIGTFPGVMEQSGDQFVGGAPLQKVVSYSTGVTAPWARTPIVFKV